MTRLMRLALVLVLVVAVAAPAAAQAPQKAVFALNWFAVGYHAAYWVALEKGYYREKGLEVELRTPRARAIPSPRWTPAAPTSGWPTPAW